MAKLVIDVDALRSLSASLARLIGDFKTVDKRSQIIGAAAGHPGLASAAKSFAHSWDGKRAKVVGSIKALREATVTMAEAWRQFDQKGAQSLQKSAVGSSRGLGRTPQ